MSRDSWGAFRPRDPEDVPFEDPPTDDSLVYILSFVAGIVIGLIWVWLYGATG